MAPLVDDQLRRRLLVSRHQLGTSGRADRTIMQSAQALALIHSTDPSTPYLSLQARTSSSQSDIDAVFYDDRSLLRHATLRRTIFAMPLDVVPLAHHSYNGRLVRTLRTNLLGWIEASPDTSMPSARFLDETSDAIVGLLRAGGATTGRALAEALPALQVRFNPTPSASNSKPIRITSRVLELLAAEGRIVRGRRTGRDLTSAAWAWEAIDVWIGADGIPELDADEALTGLVARHLATFAPATTTDVAWWTGLPKGAIRAAAERCGVRTVSLDNNRELAFVLVDDDLDAPPPNGEVALLPGLDSTTMGWKQRGWYVDDAVEAGIFDRNGNAGPTVWFEGRVVGVWTQRSDGEIVSRLLDDIGSDGHDRVDAEAERLHQWLGSVRVKWRFPTPITKQLSA